jgi:hypothetical protein
MQKQREKRYRFSMANPAHLAILGRGVEAWNKWQRAVLNRYRGDTDYDSPDLSGADLFGGRLNGIDLRRADLRGCDLRSARLVGADFRGSGLEGTRLSGANLMAAHFAPLAVHIKADTISLYPPVAGGAFTRVGPNVADSNFGFTTIDSIDLRQWSGLESARHGGRSIITIGTLVDSHGQIPLPFVRGCGFPEKLIEHLPSLFQDPIQFYSCFISYSTMDQEFADRLHGDLQNKGVRCWFAPHDIQAGKKLHEQIDEAIRLYDRLLLILSDHSMNSEWVKTEIAHDRQKEMNERRQVLFPITLVPFEKIQAWEGLDADTGKDSAREIREYFIPDFSNWSDYEAYQVAFQRLASDLQAEKADPAEGR